MDERKEERGLLMEHSVWTRFSDKLSPYMYHLSNGNIAITIPILVDEEMEVQRGWVVRPAENCT